ncbi:hypothetical protein BX616_004032 [Lobosporangium transversale]|uniref:Alpha/Beta hydrolase protein n=1 Tax=Lobosporangium transversale TaxID=64571 RepID=A0A1Y2G9C1_9FUNG|nr:hypothetical protein BCR41DRAFT_194418 [Lobosporangium transversale]KAF9916332.1 hypothetical protein BX616_004032 [Lobosporangium transversale]ORZ04724.1 hypothetical protein BCR41DRAFT_194418 [Lobosporangium transversale]|eukprot:XP_021876721.1 hypothetical protein BCR41DRAFT_194418 [Lobosporangium transversale]
MSEPTQKEISIPWPGKSAIAVTLTVPPKTVKPSGYGLILGPGAGGDEKAPLLTAVASEIAKQGHYCARYRAKVPNLGFRVSLCTRVMEHLFHPTSGLYPMKGCFLGGHSMGTRVAGTIAAQLATSKEDVSVTPKSPKKAKTKNKAKTKPTTASTTTTAKTGSSSESLEYPPNFILGLLLYSYPLHTAENPKALRDQILYDIPPMTATLFILGLKDTMCQPSLFAKVFKDMKASRREVVQVVDADHGLGFGSSIPARGKKEALIEAITEWTTSFMDETIAALVDEGPKQKTIAGSRTGSTKKKAELKKTANEWTVTTSTIPCN